MTLAGAEGEDAELAHRLKDLVGERLAEVSVKDEHKVRVITIPDPQGYVHFHVGAPATPWHVLFRVMEEAKAEIQGLEYSVSQTTLEQVDQSFPCDLLPPCLPGIPLICQEARG